MDKEFEGLLQAGTFAPAAEKQSVANVIDVKWVFTSNTDKHGWMIKAKSRSVARGFKQREEMDFSEAFGPTVSSSSVRVLIANA